jgi:precorrin-2 dehydrogenase/sirohydrochlorin ferrochelatase
MAETISPYVVCLRLADRPCLVVGGGDIAERKVRTLYAAGGRITVVAGEIKPRLRNFIKRHAITVVERAIRPEDVDDKFLVVAATDDRDTNRMIAYQAHKAGALVNIVDSPEDSDFIVPSSLRRGDLTIAITTNGKIPALSRKIRECLEILFGDEYAHYVSLLTPARKAIYTADAFSPAERKRCMDELLNLPLLPLLKKGNYDSARRMVQAFLQEHGLQ